MMILKRIAICAFMTVMATGFSAAGSHAAQKKAARGNSMSYTIGQAVEEALRANPSIEAKRLLVENARMNVGVSQSNFWPKVSLSWSSNRLKNYEEVDTYNSDNLSSFNWNKGVRVTYPLFAGFAHLTGLQKSLLQKDIQILQQQEACLNLSNNVQQQFLQLLKNREDLKTAQDSIKRLETQLASAEAFVEMDMAPYLNVLQNRTDLANARQNLIRVQNDIRNCEVQLNRYLAKPDAANITYVGSLKDFPMKSAGMTEQEAIREALARKPSLKVAQKTIEVAFKDMHITMGQYLPRIDFTYDNMASSKDYDNSQYHGYTRNYWSAGITFTWEIFSGGQTTFQTLADKKRAESLRKDYEDAVNAIRTEVIRAMLDIDSAREMVTAARSGLQAAQEAYDMAVTRYETDTGTITELLDGQLRLTQAQNDLSTAMASCQMARARLFFNLGRENASLK